MPSQEKVNAVPVDKPFELEELDAGRVVARFGVRVDHPRPGFAEELKRALRTHERVACDLRETKTLISGWIRVLRDLSIEAREAGKVVGIVGMNDDIRSSADILRCVDELSLYDTIDDVWAP